jgi:hypothetical protein
LTRTKKIEGDADEKREVPDLLRQELFMVQDAPGKRDGRDDRGGGIEAEGE